jgi:hypothetical protein
MEFDCFREMCEQLDEILRMPRVLLKWNWRRLVRWLCASSCN